ncbi:MAG: sigma-70 family RNA polymerase sigma factor [Chloroflexota bacterium]|nr:sigma-70 family RNA polymerase sigma factor [Chloroflexota bacterium]
MTDSRRVYDQDLLDLSDADLVGMTADGNPDAIGVLYDRYSGAVFAFAVRILNDRAVAEELLQEVFFRCWKQARAYSPERGSFITWLLSITHNMAIDELRRRSRRPQRADAADPVLLLANVRDRDPSVEDLALLSALRDQIGEAMQSLPMAQRETITMAYFGGLTQREIADELQEPLGTVKTRMRLGIRKLRDYVEKHEVELA